MTDTATHEVPRIGTRSMRRASGSVSQLAAAEGPDACAALGLRTDVRIPVDPTSLKPETVKKIYSHRSPIATKNLCPTVFSRKASVQSLYANSQCAAHALPTLPIGNNALATEHFDRSRMLA